MEASKLYNNRTAAFASIHSDILRPIRSAFCSPSQSLATFPNGECQLRGSTRNAFVSRSAKFLFAHSRLLLHYREIRRLSALVAFTDLIAVNDNANKTAKSKPVHNHGKLSRSVFRRIAQSCATKRFLECQVKRRTTGAWYASTIGWENYLASDASYSAALLPGLIMPRWYRKALRCYNNSIRIRYINGPNFSFFRRWLFPFICVYLRRISVRIVILMKESTLSEGCGSPIHARQKWRNAHEKYFYVLALLTPARRQVLYHRGYPTIVDLGSRAA